MIGQIEQAMIDRIQQASDSGALGYKLAKVASYGGEYSDGGIRNTIKDFPAVSIMFDGASLSGQAKNNSVTIQARFGVFVAGRNLRSEREARRGDSATPGTYKMIVDIIQLLANQNLGLEEIKEMKFDGIQLVLADKSDQGLSSVYGISFITNFTLSTLPSDAELSALDVFETFNANWDVPVFGNVSTNLPADSTADATDHVELEQ